MRTGQDCLSQRLTTATTTTNEIYLDSTGSNVPSVNRQSAIGNHQSARVSRIKAKQRNKVGEWRNDDLLVLSLLVTKHSRYTGMWKAHSWRTGTRNQQQQQQQQHLRHHHSSTSTSTANSFICSPSSPSAINRNCFLIFGEKTCMLWAPLSSIKDSPPSHCHWKHH